MQITQGAILSILIVCLGFFIKKWIQSLEDKMDKIGVELTKKTNKKDCASHIQTCKDLWEMRDTTVKELSEVLNCKCEEDHFRSHSHTEKGNIILN